MNLHAHEWDEWGRCWCGAVRPKVPIAAICRECGLPSETNTCAACREKESAYLRLCAANRLEIDDEAGTEADFYLAEERERNRE